MYHNLCSGQLWEGFTLSERSLLNAVFVRKLEVERDDKISRITLTKSDSFDRIFRFR